MTAHDQTPWDTEEPIGGFQINSTENAGAKALEGIKNRE